MGTRALAGPVTEYVAGELRAEKARLRLSLDQIAERSGLARSTINQALSGERAIAVELLIPLCQALDLDAGELLRSAMPHAVVRTAKGTRHGRGTAPPVTS